MAWASASLGDSDSLRTGTCSSTASAACRAAASYQPSFATISTGGRAKAFQPVPMTGTHSCTPSTHGCTSARSLIFNASRSASASCSASSTRDTPWAELPDAGFTHSGKLSGKRLSTWESAASMPHSSNARRENVSVCGTVAVTRSSVRLWYAWSASASAALS